MKNFYVEANGIRHSVNTYGSGAETVIFLHYLGGTKDIWETVIPYFQNDYHVLSIDLRGHGSTDQPENGYNLTDYAKDIKGIMDVLDIKNAHFVGSSFGCDVALRFAYNHPDCALSLSFSEGAMVNSTGPLGLYKETKEEHLNKFFGQHEETYESFEDFYTKSKERWQPWNDAKGAYLSGARLRRVEGGKWAFPTKQKTLLKIIDDLYDETFETYFPKITCPVLFLPAEKENGLEIKLKFIDHVRPLIPSCTTHIIPGTTHTMMFDDACEMSRIILRHSLSKVNC